MSVPYYDLRETRGINAALRDLRGFWKFWSTCLLSSCGLPTLRGIVVTHAHDGMVGEIHRFLEDMGSTVALIRHDKRYEAPPYPRGGFLVGEPFLREAIQFFFDTGRIVAVYEPADPLMNMHNINLLFESDREVYAEVVGPGFDASDLQRGDLSPHEAFSIRLSPEGNILEVNLARRVDQAAYQESVILRKEKIRKKLQSAPSVDLARQICDSVGIPEDLDAFLQEIGSPLCKSQSYQPLSQDVLHDTITAIIRSRVINRYSASTGVSFPLVFSTSLVNSGEKQVFWDIVSATLKYEGLNPHT